MLHIIFSIRHKESQVNLIKLAEDVLSELERDLLFKQTTDAPDVINGIIVIDEYETDNEENYWKIHLCKHRVWIRIIEGYIGIVFLWITISTVFHMLSNAATPGR